MRWQNRRPVHGCRRDFLFATQWGDEQLSFG